MQFQLESLTAELESKKAELDSTVGKISMTMTRSLTLKEIVTISLTVAVQRSFSTQSK